MRSTEARVFFEPTSEEDRYLPEGPRDLLKRGGSWGLIGWVNIQSGQTAKHGTVFTRAWGKSLPLFNRRDLAGRPGFLLPTRKPPWVLIGCEKQLVWHSVQFPDSLTLATIPDDNPRTIINDGEIVPGGKAIVFGTKDVLFKDAIAHLYLYTVEDNRVSVLADGQTCSNGKVFARHDRGLILFDIDTPKRNVVRYLVDVDARTATPDGVALDLGGEVGFPDGMCDCGDGTVIVAFYNPDFAAAGRAVRYRLVTGEAVEEWTTPGSPRVTCPLLVQRLEGVKLILTTATEGMPAEMRARCPTAGCLFIADTQLATCPAPEVVRLNS